MFNYFFIDNLPSTEYSTLFETKLTCLFSKSVFRGARVDYSEFIQKTYKKWGDVYEKDVNIPYIASDSWNPHCESGE